MQQSRTNRPRRSRAARIPARVSDVEEQETRGRFARHKTDRRQIRDQSLFGGGQLG